MQFNDGTFWDGVDPNTIPVLSIEAIAHALSHICRYGGHCREHYCVTPDTKVLTHDLRWIRAGSISTGDVLWGCDEENFGHRDIRKWRKSIAKVHGIKKVECFLICLSDGTELKCSREHPILASAKAAGNQKWITAETLYADLQKGRRRYIPKFVPTWDEEFTKTAGWLAGIFDGEGCLTSQSSRSMSLNIGQNPGPVLNRIMSSLEHRGYEYGHYNKKNRQCQVLTILGGRDKQLRFLGSIRPDRLLNKAIERLEGREFSRSGGLLEIVSVQNIGLQDVIALETSTHTYITEGLASHNSVAQHSVVIAKLTEPHFFLEGLLHDASEAYIGDIPAPMKWQVPEIKLFEERIQKNIFEEYNLKWPIPKDVEYLDKAIIRTEMEMLFDHISPTIDRMLLEKEGGIRQYFDLLELKEPWPAEAAKVEFIRQYKEYHEQRNA